LALFDYQNDLSIHALFIHPLWREPKNSAEDCSRVVDVQNSVGYDSLTNLHFVLQNFSAERAGLDVEICSCFQSAFSR
jgi:hypothetical protein